MEPPPRKVKCTAAVKSLHSEQWSQLQSKHQYDIDLLDDVSLFAQKRAKLEKDYAQGLVKLSAQLLQKKDFPEVSDHRSDGETYKHVYTVWKGILEQTNRIGKMRLHSAEVITGKVAEPLKIIRQNKASEFKKVQEHLRQLQAEVAQTVGELARAQKAYNEEEGAAAKIRGKAVEAEDKVKKKKTGLFGSVAALQKASSKLEVEREEADRKSTIARNEYLLTLYAANAHQRRYWNTELPAILSWTDGNLYDQLRSSLAEYAQQELEPCFVCENVFNRIHLDADTITRDYNLRCFLAQNRSFTDVMEYNFEQCKGDEVRDLSRDFGGEQQLAGEARKWAQKQIKDSRNIMEFQRAIQAIERGEEDPLASERTGNNKAEKEETPEVKIENYTNLIRKAETSREKVDARIALLQQAGVDMESYLREMQAELAALAEPQPVSRPITPPADDEEHGEETTVAELASSPPHQQPQDLMDISHTTPADISDRPRLSVVSTASSHASKPRTLSEADDSAAVTSDGSVVGQQQLPEPSLGGDQCWPDSMAAASAAAAAVKKEVGGWAEDHQTSWNTDTSVRWCTAIYDYTGANPDELSFRAGEQLEITGTDEGDGWVQGRSNSGSVGLVPENYISYSDGGQQGQAEPPAPVQQDLSVSTHSVNYDTRQPEVAPQVGQAWASSSPDVSSASHAGSEGLASAASSGAVATPDQLAVHPAYSDTTRSSHSSTDYEVQRTLEGSVYTSNGVSCFPDGGQYCRAIYNYEANSGNELSFAEGEVIRVLRRDENGVDDGFWEGEVGGRVGVFPSLLVEPLDTTQQEVPVYRGPQQQQQQVQYSAPSYTQPQQLSPAATTGLYRIGHTACRKESSV